jgi:hypothetical protein
MAEQLFRGGAMRLLVARSMIASPALAADQVNHQPRFLRRGSKVSGFGSGFAC